VISKNTRETFAYLTCLYVTMWKNQKNNEPIVKEENPSHYICKYAPASLSTPSLVATHTCKQEWRSLEEKHNTPTMICQKAERVLGAIVGLVHPLLLRVRRK